MNMRMGVVGLAALIAIGGWAAAQAQEAAAEAQFNRGATFLTRLRFADPDYLFVLIACLKESELNVLFSRHVTADEVPVLTRGLLAQLRKELPGQDVSVVTFRPVVPLREAAVARYDSESRHTSYTPGPGL
jgi:hypothetical protein